MLFYLKSSFGFKMSYFDLTVGEETEWKAVLKDGPVSCHTHAIASRLVPKTHKDVSETLEALQ